MRTNLAGPALCLCLGLLGVGCTPLQATDMEGSARAPNPQANPMFHAAYSDNAEVPFVINPKTASADRSTWVDFQSESASAKTRDVANWVVNSDDNRNMPFAIVDKVNAKAYIFSADGQLHGAAPVLLGLARGDRSAPGIGDMPLSRIPPEERTTPAGRFLARMGRNAKGKEILWVDYEDAISMHPVITSNPEERRPQRLATPTPSDNRISYGCINVPAEFFKNVVHETFSGTVGVVYVMPEMDLTTERHATNARL